MTNSRIIGQVRRVNGPVIEARGVTDAIMMELVKVGESQLIGEIIKLSGQRAIIQVYEDTTGVAPGDNIYGTGGPLSVELGPGLIGTVYDGIQRPLERLQAISGNYIERGIHAPALDRKRTWPFAPADISPGTMVSAGAVLGTVQETERVEHRILVPPGVEGELTHLVQAGDYTVTDEIASVTTSTGQRSLSMMHRWSIRQPRPVRERLEMNVPLVTGQRVIDTLFPVPCGGTVAIPGGFGTGKTMTQHAIAKWCSADLIVYIGCGERGNEITDVLAEFPTLVDPRTGRSLMERTILVANTSNMPVSAREASIYTGISLAEYFRDQGYVVAVMADSTSRWAEALRELSGRMEEMPAEEGFPAYLPTRIAKFYERAGRMKTLCGKTGSVSIIGAVSPPGGDFSEPITQHTRRFVRCFWALDRQLANARHYPAISWSDSYSEYLDGVSDWWEQEVGSTWKDDRQEILELLHREIRLQQVVKLVGPDSLPDSQRFVLEVCTLFKNGFLQQNAFDDIDKYTSATKQMRMLQIILTYRRKGRDALKRGVTLLKLRRMKVLQDVARMKFTIEGDGEDEFDRLAARLERSIDQLTAVYDNE